MPLAGPGPPGNGQRTEEKRDRDGGGNGIQDGGADGWIRTELSAQGKQDHPQEIGGTFSPRPARVEDDSMTRSDIPCVLEEDVCIFMWVPATEDDKRHRQVEKTYHSRRHDRECKRDFAFAG